MLLFHVSVSTPLFSFIGGAGGSWITWSKTVAFLAQDTRKSLDMVQVQMLKKKAIYFYFYFIYYYFLGSEGLGGMWLERGG